MSNYFGMETMAFGYATFRPPVHPYVLAQACQSAGWPRFVQRALDVGCGAGLSTKALVGVAPHCIGMEPVHTMLQWSATVAPEADFVAGTAEAMPFCDHAMDLITAAGSLNYVHLDLFFPEARRVLKPLGTLLVYDFLPGCSLRHTSSLDEWFTSFLLRYPPPASEGQVLNPEILAQFDSGFRIQSSQYYEIGIPLTPPFYLDYVLTETNVAAAVRQGTPLTEVRAWCAETLEPIWNGQEQEVLFRGYFACLAKL